MKSHDKVLKEQKGKQRILFENTKNTKFGHTKISCKLWKNYTYMRLKHSNWPTLDKVWFKLYVNINLSILGNFDYLSQVSLYLKLNLNHYMNGLLMYEI